MNDKGDGVCEQGSTKCTDRGNVSRESNLQSRSLSGKDWCEGGGLRRGERSEKHLGCFCTIKIHK